MIWDSLISMIHRYKTLSKKINLLPSFLKDSMILLLLVSITIFTYQFLITAPETVVFGDAARFNGYIAMIIKYSLIHYGQFALWDQFLSSGMSWISYPSGYHFSPIAWLTIPFFNNPALAARFMELLYISFASIAFYLLLRVFGLSRVTSFLVSIPYVANQYAFLFGVNGWFEEFMGIMLLPLTVMFVWLGITKKSYLYMLIGALVMSLNFFDNSYYVFHYNSIVILWIMIVLGLRILWKNRKENKLDFIKCAGSYISLNFVFWIGFIGISAIKLIPLLEFRTLSSRSFISLSEAEAEITRFPILWDRLRNFFITPGHTTSFTQLANDIGFFLILVCFIYFILKRSLLHGIFLSLLLIGIWGYLANNLPIDFYSLMYHFLPGFNSNKYPFRFIIIIQFAFMVCVALGIDVFMRQKKYFFGKLLGYIFGIILIFSTVSFVTTSFRSASLSNHIDLLEKVKKAGNINIIKNPDYSMPPKINGGVRNNLSAILFHIFNIYKPEGRMYSTFSPDPYMLSNADLLQGNISTVDPLYSKVLPTYKDEVIQKGDTQDTLEQTKKRFKIFSVLNTRFIMQQKEYFEYEGCNKLSLPKGKTFNEIKSVEGVCEYLEARLVPIATKEEGGIYYDKDVLPKITVLSNAILLIGDNRFTDYSGFIAKQIMFHPDFDIQTTTVLSGGSSYLDDYAYDILKQFSAVLLVEPKIKDKKRTDSIFTKYQKNGGKLVSLSSKWINYDSLHQRSGSLWTDKHKPAWNYSEKDSKEISNILSSLKSLNGNSIVIKKYTPEDLVFNTKTVLDNQVLQFSDSFYPGWKATIDGRKAPVYMADGLVKGVVIPKKGTHIIRFYYDPDSLKKGAIISGLTLILLGIFFISRLKNKIHL